ncbi:MAG: PIN domain-containing protein [Chloroflexota bacterium]
MGLTVVDAGVIIAVLDSSDAHHSAARDALHEELDGGSALVLPASAYAEVLVAPFRRDGDSANVVDSLIDALPATVQPITRAIARAAAELRAQHGSRLRLPDALVVATAVELGADRILTTDRRWPTLSLKIHTV